MQCVQRFSFHALKSFTLTLLPVAYLYHILVLASVGLRQSSSCPHSGPLDTLLCKLFLNKKIILYMAQVYLFCAVIFNLSSLDYFSFLKLPKCFLPQFNLLYSFIDLSAATRDFGIPDYTK